jgi:8-amino-7-oxononanoate synthase
MQYASVNDFYTYQQALESKTGPKVRIKGQEILMISSYDYLGLAGHPEIERSAIDCIRRFGTSTGGVRLLTGTTILHRKFERQLADFLGTEATMMFSSGYLANLAVINALFDKNDLMFVDQKIHQSIAEACKLAQVPFVKFRHNDMRSLADLLEKHKSKCRKLIISEGVFSMDGDICPLPELLDLKKKYGACLMIDESHAIGVLGKNGRGSHEFYGTDPGEIDVWTASLSKAIPSGGGYIAGSKLLVHYLQHGASPFFFSAASSPACVGAASAALEVIDKEKERLKKLWSNTRLLVRGFKRYGWKVLSDQSPIIPIFIGREDDAYNVTRELFNNGIVGLAVVYPAVSKNQARLRVCATAAMDEDIIEKILNVFAKPKIKSLLH